MSKIFISYKALKEDSTPSITISGEFTPTWFEVFRDVVPLRIISGIAFGLEPWLLFGAMEIEGSSMESALITFVVEIALNWSPSNVLAAPVKVLLSLSKYPVTTAFSMKFMLSCKTTTAGMFSTLYSFDS
ncbi:hypothetical protein SDC9_89009 [bioreactor metagenome]|uniref:Uncharacterized protein n=1 Tax=bioreactor metagenome TaxID=1076179 RepID=A0A644ZXN7_9ZZZZ